MFVIFGGMLIFGDSLSRIIALVIILFALLSAVMGSLFSYHGLAPEFAKKAVSCDK